MEFDSKTEPWVTFCMTTYKRPEFLRNQLESLFRQTDPNFYVVISDNDPEASARNVVEQFNDDRLFYYHNGENLGMIRSFNKSIQHAQTAYLVMLTDDDHVHEDMLAEFNKIISRHNNYPIYIGCVRTNKNPNETEVLAKEDFVFQILNPDKTKTILWSSCILETETVRAFGGIPEFGSPHFADHALLLLCGKYKGGVVINKTFGSLASHDQNFSKSHFELYYKGCKGFYEFISSNFEVSFYEKKNINALERHIYTWFLDNYFILKKYFTFKRFQKETLSEIDSFAARILDLSFMKPVRSKFRLRQFIFFIKAPLFFIKYRL